MSCSSMKICSGDLRHSVVVNAETKADDGAGGDAITWVEKFTIWCGMTQNSGKESFLQQDLRSVATVTFTCRYRADIFETDQLVFRGEKYNIHSIDNQDFKNRWLVIVAERRVVQ